MVVTRVLGMGPPRALPVAAIALIVRRRQDNPTNAGAEKTVNDRLADQLASLFRFGRLLGFFYSNASYLVVSSFSRHAAPLR